MIPRILAFLRWFHARPAAPRYHADNPHPWGYDAMPATPRDETHACEGRGPENRGCARAGTEAEGVRFDRGLGRWLCGPCWCSTPPPGPPPGGRGRFGRHA